MLEGNLCTDTNKWHTAYIVYMYKLQLETASIKGRGDTNFLNIELHLVLLYTCTYCHKAAIRERYSLDWSHFLGL